MAATFSDLGTISKDSNFLSRVGYAMAVAAVNVYAESTGTAGHAARVAFATKVLNGQFNLTSASIGVLTNSTIAAGANVATTPGFAILDSDIQFAVNSLWTALAGA